MHALRKDVQENASRPEDREAHRQEHGEGGAARGRGRGGSQSLGGRPDREGGGAERGEPAEHPPAPATDAEPGRRGRERQEKEAGERRDAGHHGDEHPGRTGRERRRPVEGGKVVAAPHGQNDRGRDGENREAGGGRENGETRGRLGNDRVGDECGRRAQKRGGQPIAPRGGAIGEHHDDERVGETEGDARRRRHGATVGQRADQEGAGERQDAPADLRQDVEEDRRRDGRNDPQRLARLLLVRERFRGGDGQRLGAEHGLLEAPDPGLERIQTRVRNVPDRWGSLGLASGSPPPPGEMQTHQVRRDDPDHRPATPALRSCPSSGRRAAPEGGFMTHLVTAERSLDVRGRSAEDAAAEALAWFDTLGPAERFVLTSGDSGGETLRRLQAERPGAFEWSPLQSGPPAWRIEIARRDAARAAARGVNEALSWDHDRLDALEEAAFRARAAGDLAVRLRPLRGVRLRIAPPHRLRGGPALSGVRGRQRACPRRSGPRP